MKSKIFLIFFIFYTQSLFGIEKTIDPNTIHKNLRCLVCQGQSISDSNSDFAQTIKLVVKDQINDGKSEKEIYDFLIEKYAQFLSDLLIIFVGLTVTLFSDKIPCNYVV